MQALKGHKIWKVTCYSSVSSSVPFLLCLQLSFTILETPAKQARAVMVVDKGTKTAKAGKMSVCVGQTTATGGLLKVALVLNHSNP